MQVTTTSEKTDRRALLKKKSGLYNDNINPLLKTFKCLQDPLGQSYNIYSKTCCCTQFSLARVTLNNNTRRQVP